jgi:hypothetical protein
VGAATVAFGAAQTNQLGYVSFTMYGGIALVILGWLVLQRNGGGRAVTVAAACTAALAWFSLQLFAFASAAVAVTLLAGLLRDRRSVRWPAILGAAGLTSLLVLPLALPLVRARTTEGLHREERETRLYSASLRSWLTTTSSNPGQKWLPFKSDSETALYPGSAALLLGLVAFAGRKRGGAPRRIGASASAVTVAVLLTGLGVLGSLGFSGPVHPILAWLAPPLFRGIRAAARYGFVAHVGFGLLASAGLERVLELSAVRWRRPILAAVLVLAFLDQRQSVRILATPELPPAPVESFLARIETGGPILHLPFTARAYDSRYLLASLAHFKPIVNGSLSYVPKAHQELAARLDAVPIAEDSLDALERWPVGVIVLHEHAVPLEKLGSTIRFLVRGVREKRLSEPRRFDHRGGEDWVFAVRRVRGDWDAAEAKAARDTSDEFLAKEKAGVPKLPAAEDASFPASIDGPPENGGVSGRLTVRGWTQDEGGPGTVLEILIDGDRRRTALKRVPRPDVAAALPRLGDCSAAGYEADFAFLPGDEGRHEVRVRFRSSGGKVRTLTRTFLWTP